MTNDRESAIDRSGDAARRRNGHGGDPIWIDSRTWTGRALGPTRAERRAAWQAFRLAAGPAATAPRRAAAIACGIGGVLAALAIAAISPDRLPWLTARLEETVASVANPGTVPTIIRWLAAFVGPALAIGMAGAIAGAASAWHNRDALSRGFVTPSADGLERGGADVVIALIAFGLMIRQSWQPSIGAVLALWMLSCFLAHAMTMTRSDCSPRPASAGGWRSTLSWRCSPASCC